MTKNYKGALKYLYNLEKTKGIKLGLENILNLLNLMKNPQKNFKTIHVAGTNGKGSCAAMIASILSESGFKVGLYTSPHLIDFRERIVINGEKIPEKDFVKILNKIKSFININEKLTFFEVVTAVAFEYFSEQKVDFAVLEVGMGGRLDATNVANPLVSVITNVSLEHEKYLGTNLLQIAGEKAGIIKENSILVTAEKNPEILDLIKRICREKNTRIICVGEYGDVKYEQLNYNLYSQEFYYFYYVSKNENKKIENKKIENKKIESKRIKFNIPLIGKYQLDNASCAVAAVMTLKEYNKEYNIKISNDNIYSGLKKTRWKGRCEIIQKNPLIVLDAAHNPAGIFGLRDALFGIRKISNYRNLILIIGVLKNKNFKKMLEIIAPAADEIILAKPKTPIALDPKIIHEYLIKLNIKNKNKNKLNIKNILIKEKVSDALKFALSKADNKDAICVTGSLFTVGDAMKYIKNE